MLRMTKGLAEILNSPILKGQCNNLKPKATQYI